MEQLDLLNIPTCVQSPMKHELQTQQLRDARLDTGIRNFKVSGAGTKAKESCFEYRQFKLLIAGMTMTTSIAIVALVGVIVFVVTTASTSTYHHH